MSFKKKQLLKTLLIFLLFFLYVISFIFSFNAIGIIGIMFSLLPIIVAASIYGRFGGWTASITIFFVNLGLIYYAVGWVDIRNPGISLGSIFLILVGIFVGWTTDKDKQVRNELEERRVIEEQLAQAEAWYRSIFDGVNDAIFVESMIGEVLEVNERACEIFGWTREEFLTKTVNDMVPPEYQALVPDETNEDNLSEEPFETVNVRANGEYFSVSVSGRIQKIGEEKRLLVLVRDITEQKIIENEIKRHHQFLSHIIESLTQPFYVVNVADYSIAIANSSARGYSALESATTCYALTHKRDTPCSGADYSCPLQEVVRTRSVVRVEHIHHNENGEERYFEVYGYPIFDSTGNVSQIIEYSLDISERKQAMTALEKAKEEAEAATNAKALFLANMSHEIRTPLNAIYGMTSLMLDTPLNEEQEDFISTIRSGSDTLLRVINDILDFSKIEAGKMALEKQPFSLEKCVKESLNLLAEKATEKSLILAYKIEAGTPLILLGDITRLRQILVNLLNNAIKFTDKGEVFVHIQKESVEANLSKLHFSVCDTGIGIPKDKMNKLFESFSQVDASTTRKYGGTGLGLVISKELVEKMGGEMWVESEVGKGTTFHFTVFIETAQELEKRSQKTPINSDMGKKKPLAILLVEDNLINQKVASKLLERLGYETDLASNGFEAIDALENKFYDVVFMDIQMPEMDGDEATKRIRATLPEEHQPHIIAMTAHALEGDREKYLGRAMDGYVSKPIGVAALMQALDEVGR